MPFASATPVALVAGEPGGPDVSSGLRSLAAALPPDWQPALWPAAAPGRLLVRAMDAVRAIRAGGVELVHVDAAAAAPPFVAAARWLGRPSVVRVGEAVTGGRTPRLALALADAVVFDSVAARAAAGWRSGWVIPRGVDPPVGLGAEAARRALGALPGEVVVAQMGPLEPLLGCDLALEAVAALCHKALPVRLALIGEDRLWEGRYRSVLRALASGLDVADRVTFAGEPSAGASLLRGVDIVVCAARAGLTPHGVPAALAAAVPVVATRVGAASEWVCDGHDGLLVAPEDLGGLVGALERLVSDAALRREMGARAARRARAEFSWEVCARRMAQVYATVSAPYLGAATRVGETPSRRTRP